METNYNEMNDGLVKDLSNDPTNDDYDRYLCVNLSRRFDTGADRLCLELVRDATMFLGTYRDKKYNPAHIRKKLKEIIEWINSDEDQYVFSFVAICERYGFEPVACRTRLLTASAEQILRSSIELKVRNRTGYPTFSKRYHNQRKIDEAKETSQRPVRRDRSEKECDPGRDTLSLSREVEAIAS